MVTPAIFADVVAWPPGATAMDIAGAERQLGRRLPDDYRHVLLTTDGPEGHISEETYLQLLSVQGIRDWNIDPATSGLFRDVVIIGSNGAGEGYGIVYGDRGTSYAGFPFIGFEQELVVVLGRTFDELIERIRGTPPPWT